MAGIIVVHGAPGAGKTTQSRKLSTYLIEGRQIRHISAGERLRAIRNGEFQSKYGIEVNSPNAPDPLDHQLVNKVIFESIALCPPDSIILVDGYPCFIEAVGPFLEALREDNHLFLGCLNLQISQETSIIRLSARGIRQGERVIEINENVSERRYREHMLHTPKTIGKLGEMAPIININAELSREEVWQSFNDAFEKLVRNYIR